MYTLGINAVYHDPAACLVQDGQVIAAAEEERFTRIKHGKRPIPFSTYELPFHAIDYCLREAEIYLDDIDHIAYSYDPFLLLGHYRNDMTISLPLEPSAHPTPSEWESAWDPLFLSSIVNAPRHLVDGVPHHLKARFRSNVIPSHQANVNPSHRSNVIPSHQANVILSEAKDLKDRPYRWHFVEHHIAHAASAFHASPFETAAVLTLDGRGEKATTSYSKGSGNALHWLGQVDFPHSLGLLYEQVTAYLGFLHSSDEYKVMALASFGKPRYLDDFREIIQVTSNGQYTTRPPQLEERFGPPRMKGGPLEQRHYDIAHSLQVVLEETVLEIVDWLYQATAAENLCMAGGVALNCVMNSRIRDRGPFQRVWVQPAAGDAGTALGAALWIDALERCGSNVGPSAERSGAHFNLSRPSPIDRQSRPVPQRSEAERVSILRPSHSSKRPPEGEQCHPERSEGSRPSPMNRPYRMDHAFLGPSYSDDGIEQFLQWAKLRYRRLTNIAEEVAEILAQDKVIGWFQHRMEFGPRALGARSILASPLSVSMQARLNEIKDREDFRPVAPVVLEEEASNWFANADVSPFMLFVYDVLPEKAERIPAVRHVDGTARIQTISRSQHPLYYDLIKAFQARTGVPVLVNTSFNTRGEPIVCSPRDAVECFWTSPLDALVIGPFLLEKSKA